MNRNEIEKIAAKEVGQLPTLAASLIKSEDKYIIIGRRELIKWLADTAMGLANEINENRLKTEAELGRTEREACAKVLDDFAILYKCNSAYWDDNFDILISHLAKQIRERGKVQ